MTLNNSMSITPLPPAPMAWDEVETWVNSRWKNPCRLGQFSAEINKVTKTAAGNTLIGVAVDAVDASATSVIGRVRLNAAF
jgi:hypothetical protein